jgi:rod shape determining protein RodA
MNWVANDFASSRPGGHRTLSSALHVDLPLLLGLLFLAALGLIILYSAGNQNMDLITRQATRLGIGFMLMFVIAQISPRQLKAWTPWIFTIGTLMLVAVLVFGEGKGAQRWLDLRFVRFQPSEIMKLAVPMMVAWFFADRSLPPSASRVIQALVLIAVPSVLVAKQPDLGTALLIGFGGLVVLLFAGIRWKIIFGFGFLVISALPLLWYGMHDYQRQRVLTFLNPEADPLGAGWHIVQSKIAIGSGGLYGKGWLNGSQAHLEFLPERSTDFIFAVYGEEFGLIGILIMLAIYLFIIGRGLFIASQAQDTFGRLLAGSLTITFFFNIFVNIGMVTGLLPIVGLPLPIISYGGTSLVTLMTAFGMLMSVQTHRKFIAT